MSETSTSPPPKLSSQLPSRLVMLFLLVANVALGLVLLFRLKPESPYLWQIVLANIGLALASGFGSRFLLRERHFAIRFLAALASLIAGLLVMGWASAWRIGLGPLQFWSRSINWLGLIYLLTGAVTILLTLQAWMRPPPIVPTATPVERPAPPRKTKPKRKRVSHRARAATRPKSNPEPAKVAEQPRATSKSPSRPIWRISKRKPKVHLSSIEEHLCPYCLEPVLPKDPRGIVECKVCHTKHHKDCWEITGSCQVPHLNA